MVPTRGPVAQMWASSRGTKMRAFLAHWWRRMALGHALNGETRSVKVRTGVILARRRAERRPGVGFATIGSLQFWSRQRSGVALPMYEKSSPKRSRNAANLFFPDKLLVPSEERTPLKRPR